MERRNLLLGASGAALAVASTAAPADAALSEIRQRFQEIFYDAVTALQDAVDALVGLLDADGQSDDAAQKGIRDAISLLSKIETSGELEELTRVEFGELTTQIVNLDSMASPDPEALEVALAAGEADRPGDNWEAAIRDILLESMGFTPDEAATLTDLLPFADVVSDIGQLRSAVAEGDWARARRLVERIVRKVFSRQVITTVIAEVEEELARKLLRSIAARAVPYLGWAWFVAALSLSIFRNRERLLNLVR